MKLFKEINEEVEILTEEDENGNPTYQIRGVFMQSNVKNRNGRMYPKETLFNEANRYLEQQVKKKRAYGELGHPDSPTINLDRVSHMITNLEFEGDNVIGTAKVMDTPNGQIVKELMKEGASLGVSSRGLGSLKAKSGVQEVQTDFRLATPADIVADPSAPDAFVHGIMEGVEFYYDENRGWIAENTRDDIERLTRSRELNEETKFKLFRRFVRNL